MRNTIIPNEDMIIEQQVIWADRDTGYQLRVLGGSQPDDHDIPGKYVAELEIVNDPRGEESVALPVFLDRKEDSRGVVGDRPSNFLNWGGSVVKEDGGEAKISLSTAKFRNSVAFTLVSRRSDD